MILKWEWKVGPNSWMAATLMGCELTLLHEAFQARLILTFVGTFTGVAPHVSSKICLMSELSRAAGEVALERLLAGVNSHVTHEFVLLAEFLATPKDNLSVNSSE